MTPQELKNSILQLAIKGKLVEQRPEEGTAQELYQRIQAEKQNLKKIGTIKKEKTLQDISEDVIPFDIPENWRWFCIGDYCVDVFSGKSPIYSKEETEYWVIGQAANQQNGLDYDQVKYTTSSFWQAMDKRYFLRPNDVLLNTLGNGTLGRSGIIESLAKPLLTDGHLFVFRLINDVSSRYFYYFLQSKRSEIEKAANGSTNQTFLSLGNTLKWIIPVPPFSEQKRIVAKIEELLPYIDRYEKAWSNLEDFNKRFPNDIQKSILQVAIQGKLVEQRPEEGTGEELYRQIQAEKQRRIKAGIAKKEKPLPEIAADEFLADIPETWKWVRLLDIIEERPTNGYSPKGVDYETPIRNLTLTATTTGYFKADAFKYVDISLEVASKYWLNNNDLLIQRSNSRELVGTSCIYTGEDKEYIYPDLMMRMRTMVIAKYVDFVMKSPTVRNYFMKSASGTSESMPKINQDIVACTLIPLPPIAEQKRIVTKLEEILAHCEKLK
ncbi:MAG TPA: restriction endonuclease subunit S [Clostridia bacterium]|nr:restriction endonuclease subunit S [Clostridia bacterium]